MSFKIALLQFNPIRKNVALNIRKIRRALKGIKSDLIVLPELANSGYLYESTKQLRPISESNEGEGLFLSSIKSIANDTGGLIITGYAECDNTSIYNSAAAVSSEGVIANYRKVHLYSDEKDLFKPGDKEFNLVEWKQVQIGMMICFDWVFPESARSLALLGAQIIAHPANLVLPYCQDAMVTRSIENQLFTITANRIGTEKLSGKSLQFTGKSQITSPSGAILFRGPENKATVHIMDIDPEKALDKNISERNNLFEDRRTGLYNLE